MLASLLAVIAMWAGGFLISYLAKHSDTILLYFRTLHSLLREQDDIIAGRVSEADTVKPTSLLSDGEQNTFDELVNRLKNS